MWHADNSPCIVWDYEAEQPDNPADSDAEDSGPSYSTDEDLQTDSDSEDEDITSSGEEDNAPGGLQCLR